MIYLSSTKTYRGSSFRQKDSPTSGLPPLTQSLLIGPLGSVPLPMGEEPVNAEYVMSHDVILTKLTIYVCTKLLKQFGVCFFYISK